MKIKKKILNFFFGFSKFLKSFLSPPNDPKMKKNENFGRVRIFYFYLSFISYIKNNFS